MTDFTAFFRSATGGHDPYPYQRRLAMDGLPDLIKVPTGTGKTLAAFLPWCYRRRVHPEPAVRHTTPRRLVIVLPQRSLVEQTRDVIRACVDRLAASGVPSVGTSSTVGVHVLMGGASTDDREWKMSPAADAVLIGTQDMVLSRLLMRGYGEPMPAWPIAFGLLHSDTHYVFDEIQLMGPGLPTSLQLAGLREKLGTAAPCRSTWMSATVDEATFAEAPDYAGISTVVGLGDEDRGGTLSRRLRATRLVSRLDVDLDPKRYPSVLAERVLGRHRPGARTLVVLNTVDRACEVYDAIRRRSRTAPVVLLHSRFRPADRRRQMEKALAEPSEDGSIVVSTQVLEAGVDVTCSVLVTEVAPWSSIVQRAGRCNRGGEEDDATLLWTPPPDAARGKGSAPYDDEDLRAAAEALEALDGTAVTSTLLQEHRVEERRPLYPVLRRRDLLDVFDTTPDLTGNDLDVGRWIRDADVVSADVAWRDPGPDGPSEGTRTPAREELCPAPLPALRELVKAPGKRAWLYDRGGSAWRAATAADVRPGAVLVLDALQGGYAPDRGWAPKDTGQVEPVDANVDERPDGVGDDHLTPTGRAVTLARHCEDVRHEVAGLLDAFGDLPGLTASYRRAAAHAALCHDLGKAHEVFVRSLERSGVPDGPGPWAKSLGSGRLAHERPAFRHELVSALMVLAPESGLLDGIEEGDLTAYLVAAHHGKVRLAARSVERDVGDLVLGVGAVETTPELVLADGRRVPSLTLRRDVFQVGEGSSGPSWGARVGRLLHRADLGPFRLAFLEAVVRMADWRASSSYREESV